MNESNDGPNVTERLLGHFFHEVFSRVAPGLVVLALYEHERVVKAYSVFHDSSIIYGLSIVVSAWLIGFALDTVINIFIIAAEKCSKERLKKWNEKRFGPVTKRQNSEGMMSIPDLKSLGEALMSRSLCMIFLFSIFVPPPLFSGHGWHRCYGVILFALFFVDYGRKAKFPLLNNKETEETESPRPDHFLP